jgi:ribosome-associated toxin RatA of RatAB toxin-antitoxin module|tara:strand:+ start:123 stop:518 length:396 start_codon:yes stop_codon:yes gene_type:complete
MEIIKEIGHISCSNRSLTNFFSDIKNYKEVFSNEVSSFEILNENAFEIKIGSFPKISLTHSKSNKNSFSLKSNSNNFEFEILINLWEISSKSSRCQIIFNGNFSMMIEMMAKKPLENFLTNIAKKIEKLEL